MFFWLCEYLKFIGVKIPAAFTYSSTRMLFAAMTALLLTIILGSFVINKLYALKTGQSIRVEDCPLLAELHKKKKETPTMGGILILFSMLVSLLLWMDLKSPFTLILMVTTVGLGVLGGYDDYLKLKYKNSKGLKGKKKLFFQLLLAGMIGLYLLCPAVSEGLKMGNWFVPPMARDHTLIFSLQQFMGMYFLPFFKDPLVIAQGIGLVLSFLFILFIVTGSSNAVNLTDGLDGLAAGCLVMVALVLASFAFLSNNLEISKYLNILYIEGSGEVAIYLSALIGACLGFLWYNGYPAQVFMGDTGSLALGGVIGVSAILLKRELLLGIVGGIFVAEALSVILQVGSFKLRKRRVFLCAPLHHHFEYKGWPETKVVLRFWIIGLILAIIGIVSLKLQ